VPHVLLVMHPMNHAAGAKKHQRLEKGVGHYVENSDRERPTPQAMNMNPSCETVEYARLF